MTKKTNKKLHKRDEVNMNKRVKWRRFIEPKKDEQINDYLFIDTYKLNKITIGMNEMRMYDIEMSMR
jgi:hypothetical protein